MYWVVFRLFPAMKSTSLPLVVFSAAVLLPAALSAAVKMPHVFGDHMVLQRDGAIPVWGWADPGEQVTVRLGATVTASAQADPKGKWRVDLPAQQAGGPFTLTIKGSNEITFQDVLIGEVWLCSGQSNMQMTVDGVDKAQEEMAAANFPQIRHIAVPNIPADTPTDDRDMAWQVCSPQTAGHFSAVAYFFGRHLQKELGVPVGLINSSWGGTRIEPWTPLCGFDGMDSLADIRASVASADPAGVAYRQGVGAFLDAQANWNKAAREKLAQGLQVPSDPPAFPAALLPITSRPSSNQVPTALYNGMIQPLVPFGLRGSIWYQGESNHGEGMLYVEKTRALVRGWRNVWGKPDLPFYFVQIAPFEYGNEAPDILPLFWTAQQACLEIPNTGMAVITDIGNTKNIHPTNKQEVGRRLALIALARDYGKKDVVYSGPVFKNMETQGEALRVRFDHAEGGLATRDGKAPDWFEISGEGAGWTKAEAKIDGDCVILTAAAVKAPSRARFAWHKLAEPNLTNKAGLPATAFKAGNPSRPAALAALAPDAKDYQIVYDLDLGGLGHDISYDFDLRSQIRGRVQKIGYFLELTKQGEAAKHVFVTMDPFTQDLGKIGVPTPASGAVFQQAVTGLRVASDVPGLASPGDESGWIEFWPSNYGAVNSAKVPGAADDVYDFGDEPAAPPDGYGCMQVHVPSRKLTVFALNHWSDGPKADVGIGNSEGKTRDWTFTAQADTYTQKRLVVLVKAAP